MGCWCLQGVYKHVYFATMWILTWWQSKLSVRLLMNPMREMLVSCRNVNKLVMVSPTVGVGAKNKKCITLSLIMWWSPALNHPLA